MLYLYIELLLSFTTFSRPSFHFLFSLSYRAFLSQQSRFSFYLFLLDFLILIYYLEVYEQNSFLQFLQPRQIHHSQDLLVLLIQFDSHLILLHLLQDHLQIILFYHQTHLHIDTFHHHSLPSLMASLIFLSLHRILLSFLILHPVMKNLNLYRLQSHLLHFFINFLTFQSLLILHFHLHLPLQFNHLLKFFNFILLESIVYFNLSIFYHINPTFFY